MSDDIIIRPPVSLYRGSFEQRFCHEVIQYMKTGRSFKSFAGRIGISPTTLNKWAEENEDFAEAVEIGKAIALGTWEDIAMDQATGETKGQSSTLTFMMKNLFPEDYKDKVNIEQEGNISFIVNTGIPSELPPHLLTVKDVEVDYEDVSEEDDGWESLDEDLL